MADGYAEQRTFLAVGCQLCAVHRGRLAHVLLGLFLPVPVPHPARGRWRRARRCTATLRLLLLDGLHLIVGHRAHVGPVGGVGGLVLQFPRGLLVARDPRDGDFLIAVVRHYDVGGDTDGRGVAVAAENHIGTVGSGATGTFGRENVDAVRSTVLILIVGKRGTCSMAAVAVRTAIGTGGVDNNHRQVVRTVILERRQEIERVPSHDEVGGAIVHQLRGGGSEPVAGSRRGVHQVNADVTGTGLNGVNIEGN